MRGVEDPAPEAGQGGEHLPPYGRCPVLEGLLALGSNFPEKFLFEPVEKIEHFVLFAEQEQVPALDEGAGQGSALLAHLEELAAPGSDEVVRLEEPLARLKRPAQSVPGRLFDQEDEGLVLLQESVESPSIFLECTSPG